MKVIMFIFLLGTYCMAFAQRLLWTQDMPDARIVGIDRQGNAYIIQNDVLKLFDAKGVLRYTYSNYSHGSFVHVNISNPFKIYVLQSSGNVLVVLNNTLSVMTELFIKDIQADIFPLLVCPSRADGFWIYDNTSGQVLLFSNTVRLLSRSVDMRRLFSQGFEPDGMDWSGNHLVIYSRDGRVVMCDQFGQVVRHTILPGTIFSVSERGIVFMADGRCILYDLLRFTEEEISVDTTQLDAIYLQGSFIIIQRGHHIELYQY